MMFGSRISLAVEPTALASRLPPMAICAAHFALRDLGLDGLPRKSRHSHVRDVRKLLADMVELKNDRVGLATVDTTVIREVLPHARLIDSS